MKKNLDKVVKVVCVAVAIVFVSSKLSIISNPVDDVYGEEVVSQTSTVQNVQETENVESTVEGAIVDGVQVIEFDLQSNSLPSLNLQAGVPVKLIINADENNLNSCNYRIISNTLGIQQQLDVGVNEITFTPNEVGQFSYSCWMGMIGANINVEENITPSAVYGENVSAGGCCGR